MILLFSSDVRPRYKSDILDSLCYGCGHVQRLRYQERHVSPDVRAWAVRASGRVKIPWFQRKALIIFCDTTEAQARGVFRFYPVRQGKIAAIWKRGTVYYVDVMLRGFVNYHWGNPASVDSAFQEYQRQIARIVGSPFPRALPDGTQLPNGYAWNEKRERVDNDPTAADQNPGYFFLKTGKVLEDLVAARPSNHDDRAWESTIDALCAQSSIANALFYRIEGLFRVSRRHRERLIKPRTIVTESQYSLPMGSKVVLKLVFYRPDSPPHLTSVDLKVDAIGDGFAGVLPSDIKVDSRYNEQRVIIASKRVLDNVIAPIAIKLKEPPKTASTAPVAGAAPAPAVAPVPVLLSEPFLLAQIAVSRFAIFWIILGLVIGAILLSIGPDYAKAIGDWQWVRDASPTFADFLKDRPADASSLAKVAAATLTIITGYYGLRKLPLGK